MKEIAKTDLSNIVAQSDLIARVELTKKIDANQLKPKEYLRLDAQIIEIYKGNEVTGIIPIKHYIQEKNKYNFKKLNDQELIVFLVDLREDKYNQCFFFTTNNCDPSLEIYNDAIQKEVTEEIARQTSIITKFTERSKTAQPYEEEVKKLIEEMLDPTKAENAYKALEALGKDAVPAIIHHMNDERPLAVKHIMLENKAKNAWEAYRHYGPTVIIELLEAILNQITGMSFGQIYNGGTHAQRMKAFHGWVVWLSKQ